MNSNARLCIAQCVSRKVQHVGGELAPESWEVKPVPTDNRKDAFLQQTPSLKYHIFSLFTGGAVCVGCTFHLSSKIPPIYFCTSHSAGTPPHQPPRSRPASSQPSPPVPLESHQNRQSPSASIDRIPIGHPYLRRHTLLLCDCPDSVNPIDAVALL